MEKRRVLLPVDGVFIGYFVVLSFLVLVLSGPTRFHLLHATIVVGILVVAWAHHRWDNRFWRLIHYWLPAPATLGAFRELHFLIPSLRVVRYDWALEALDRRWFGDVASAVALVVSRPLADVLFFCYALFFPLPAILFAVLHVRGKWVEFRESAAVVFMGWLLTYLGYIAVPALGPHLVVDRVRMTELDGLVCGKFLYGMLAAMELETLDAFPSGHALIAVLVLWMAWRHARGAFWALLPLGAGIFVSTVLLRYHYLVDVVAALFLVPVAVVVGGFLARRWEAGGGRPAE